MKRRLESSPTATQQSQRPIDSPYLTSHEAVSYLRLGSLSALYALVREHRLPHGRRGDLYLFDKRELDAWVKGFGSSVEWARAKRSA